MARCGDGFLRDDLAQDAPGYEACDDGNAENTDGCLTTCALARCSDGFVRDGEEACDDGDGNDRNACRNNCEVAACGDGVRRQDLEARGGLRGLRRR